MHFIPYRPFINSPTPYPSGDAGYSCQHASTTSARVASCGNATSVPNTSRRDGFASLRPACVASTHAASPASHHPASSLSSSGGGPTEVSPRALPGTLPYAPAAVTEAAAAYPPVRVDPGALAPVSGNWPMLRLPKVCPPPVCRRKRARRADSAAPSEARSTSASGGVVPADGTPGSVACGGKSVWVACKRNGGMAGPLGGVGARRGSSPPAEPRVVETYEGRSGGAGGGGVAEKDAIEADAASVAEGSPLGGGGVGWVCGDVPSAPTPSTPPTLALAVATWLALTQCGCTSAGPSLPDKPDVGAAVTECALGEAARGLRTSSCAATTDTGEGPWPSPDMLGGGDGGGEGIDWWIVVSAPACGGWREAVKRAANVGLAGPSEVLRRSSDPANAETAVFRKNDLLLAKTGAAC